MLTRVRTGKFFWYVFIIFLTLNLMCFYGVMGVYITPDLIVGTVLSAFFYGFWCACSARKAGLWPCDRNSARQNPPARWPPTPTGWRCPS